MSEMGLIQGATCLVGYRAPLTMCDKDFARIWGGEYKHKNPATGILASCPRAACSRLPGALTRVSSAHSARQVDASGL